MWLIDRFKKYWASTQHHISSTTRQWQVHGFDQNANDAIWFFGCSHVYASFLPVDQSAPYHLSLILNKKVINYAIPGSGPMMVEWQLDQLLKKYKPKAIVIAWSAFIRWQTQSSPTAFPLLWQPGCLDGGDAHHHNDWAGCKKVWPDLWKEYYELVTSGQVEQINYNTVMNVREKIKGIPSVEFEYMPWTGLEGLPRPCWPFIDLANDGDHPGPKTQKLIAEWVGERLHGI